MFWQIYKLELRNGFFYCGSVYLDRIRVLPDELYPDLDLRGLTEEIKCVLANI